MIPFLHENLEDDSVYNESFIQGENDVDKGANLIVEEEEEEEKKVGGGDPVEDTAADVNE